MRWRSWPRTTTLSPLAKYSSGSNTSNSAAWPNVWKNFATSSRPRWIPAKGSSDGPAIFHSMSSLSRSRTPATSRRPSAPNMSFTTWMFDCSFIFRPPGMRPTPSPVPEKPSFIWHADRSNRLPGSTSVDIPGGDEVMADDAYPGGDIDERDHNDADRGNNPSESADPGVISEGADQAIHEGRNFPSGGGEGGTDREGGTTSGTAEGQAPRGSTGRGSTDAGKTDAEGTPGGGVAGSAGG